MHLYECSMLFLYDEDPDIDRLDEIKNGKKWRSEVNQKNWKCYHYNKFNGLEDEVIIFYNTEQFSCSRILFLFRFALQVQHII